MSDVEEENDTESEEPDGHEEDADYEDREQATILSEVAMKQWRGTPMILSTKTVTPDDVH